jgi:hypothetical protein
MPSRTPKTLRTPKIMRLESAFAYRSETISRRYSSATPTTIAHGKRPTASAV